MYEKAIDFLLGKIQLMSKSSIDIIALRSFKQ